MSAMFVPLNQDAIRALDNLRRKLRDPAEQAAEDQRDYENAVADWEGDGGR